MKRALLLTVSFLIVTGVAAASERHNQIEIADSSAHSEVSDGRIVEVTAQVVAINADSKAMELFDSQSKTMIQVRLTQLRKSERSALMLSGVRRVAVSGRASMVGGRFTIDAQRVVVVPLATNIEDETATEAGTDDPR